MGIEFKQKDKIQDWFMVNKPAAEMVYKDAMISQVLFVRDDLAPLITQDLSREVTRTETTFVISTHISKSVRLPVYLLERPGLMIVLRDNFHDWKMTVISEKEVKVDFSRLFHTIPPVEPSYTGNPLARVYFEGFPADLIYDYYEKSDYKKWSAALYGRHYVWTAVWTIACALDFIKPLEWSTSAKYREEIKKKEQREVLEKLDQAGEKATAKLLQDAGIEKVMTGNE